MAADTKPDSTPWEIEVFFDGQCPLCRREIRLLQRCDIHHHIRFTNIAAPQFDAGLFGHLQQELMAEIHGRLPDGRRLRGVEVFRRLYAAVGWRRRVAVSRWPAVASFLEFAYRQFARNRLRLTGRCHSACARGAA